MCCKWSIFFIPPAPGEVGTVDYYLRFTDEKAGTLSCDSSSCEVAQSQDWNQDQWSLDSGSSKSRSRGEDLGGSRLFGRNIRYQLAASLHWCTLQDMLYDKEIPLPPGYVSFNMSRVLSRPVEGAGGMSREEECLLPFLCGRGLHSVCEDIQWSSPQLWAQTWSFCNFAALAWR